MKKTLLTLALALVQIVTFGQAPAIQYTSPQTYTVGTAISPLAPTNTGGAAVNGTYVSGLAGRSRDENGTTNLATFSQPNALVVDNSGNIYIADTNNYKIRKISPTGVVTTFAGSGKYSSVDGLGTAASFQNPTGIAIDGIGNLYVTDRSKIRKITPAGMVTTFAGSDTQGSADGIGTAASFFGLEGIAIDGLGNFYVTDGSKRNIRKINPSGLVTTLAGGGGAQWATDGIGTAASFISPRGIALDGSGNIFVSESNDGLIRKISPSGVVTTFAGSGQYGSVDGLGTAASFRFPYGLACDSLGNLYVADGTDNKIRKISPLGMVSTFAGNGTSGHTDGLAANASFYGSIGLTVDTLGNFFVSENIKIRKISTTGIVTTIAGTDSYGTEDGTGIEARFNSPTGVAVDTFGNVYVTDGNNNKIRKISPLGLVTTLAGSGLDGSNDGLGSLASFKGPYGIAVDALGNVFVSDSYKIRKISPTGMVTTLAGSGIAGSADGIGTAASFKSPRHLVVDALGNVFVADYTSYKIRKITPSGEVTTFAGNSSQGLNDGVGTFARFNYPIGIAIDASGYLYVSDYNYRKIRKISPSQDVTTLTTVNVTPLTTYNSDGVAVDSDGNVYLAENASHTIRKTNSSGVETIFAGWNGHDVVDGWSDIPRFFDPSGLAIDASGNMYVADTGNNKIRKITKSAFSISPALPAGLIFNTNTGVISGTPTVSTPAINYAITACNVSGCSTAALNIATSILGSTIFNKKSIVIYPNPTNTKLNLQLPNEGKLDKITITDLTGKEVLTQTTNTNQVDVASLAKGTYIIEVFTGEEKYSSKFIKE